MPKQKAGKERLVLLVDNFEDFRAAFGRFLEQNGFRVAEANNGQEALDQASRLQPDLVLMDFSLPGISGWEATRNLRNHSKTKHIPVVIFTAHTLDLETQRIIEGGCDGWLNKTTPPDDLLKEITHLLDTN